MKPEAKQQKKALDWLNDQPRTAAWKVGDFNIVGWPDVLVCHNGLFAAFEMKVKGGKGPTPKQLYLGKQITEAGGRHAVARTLDEVKTKFKEWFGV